MSEPIISVSGLRGIVGESLTPDVALRYAAAFVGGQPPGPIVLSYDGRPSGPMFLSAIADGLVAMGRDVVNAGVAATPTTGVLVKQLNNPGGGIQISASHNPAEYNGLKLFSAEGRVIPGAEGAKVLARYRAREFPPRAEQPGTVKTLIDPARRHFPLVLETVNVQRIRDRKFHVVLDSNHGAGGHVGILLLGHLNCKVTFLGGEPDGKFAHPPEPTAENLQSVLSAVTKAGADVGFCQDPDADRLAIIDAGGRYLGEEYTLALCADHVLRTRPGPVVTNCSTSRMTQDLAEKYGVPFHRTAVGEANVVDGMLAHGAVLGGEGNGGVIDPRVVLVRDSFTAMAVVLDAMAARELPVAALADELPRYEIFKTKVSMPADKLSDALGALEKHFADARPDRLDGLRLDWPDRWLLVRGSNTEPIVRIVAEAPTAETAKAVCDDAAAALGQI